MNKFFGKNIERRGRIVRAIYGLALIALALIFLRKHLWLLLIVSALGVFGLFEALRGWCLARACGIKTKV